MNNQDVPDALYGFAVRLAGARKQAGMRQLDLAKALGVSQPTIGGWEMSTREPKLSEVYRIANALGVNVGHLVAGVDPVDQENGFTRLADEVARIRGLDVDIVGAITAIISRSNGDRAFMIHGLATVLVAFWPSTYWHTMGGDQTVARLLEEIATGFDLDLIEILRRTKNPVLASGLADHLLHRGIDPTSFTPVPAGQNLLGYENPRSQEDLGQASGVHSPHNESFTNALPFLRQVVGLGRVRARGEQVGMHGGNQQ